MILVDSSIWIDHLRNPGSALAGMLDRGEVLVHPFVIGELALGTLRQPAVAAELHVAAPHAGGRQ